MRAAHIAAALLLMLHLLPVAGAQLTFEVHGPSSPLLPGVEWGTVEATATLECAAAMLLATPEQEVAIALRFEDPAAGILLPPPPNATVPLDACTTDPASPLVVQMPFQVGVTLELPAPEPVNVTVKAQARGGGLAASLVGPLDALDQFSVAATPRLLLLILVGGHYVEVQRGETVTAPFQVGNIGNTPVTVHPDLIESPPDAGAWLRPLEAVALAQGEGKPVPIVFDVPDAAPSGPHLFRFSFTPEFQGHTGDAPVLFVVLDIQDESWAAPPPGGWPLVAVIVAAAYLVRRRP